MLAFLLALCSLLLDCRRQFGFDVFADDGQRLVIAAGGCHATDHFLGFRLLSRLLQQPRRTTLDGEDVAIMLISV